jgi:hypothetical protein
MGMWEREGGDPRFLKFVQGGGEWSASLSACRDCPSPTARVDATEKRKIFVSAGNRKLIRVARRLISILAALLLQESVHQRFRI